MTKAEQIALVNAAISNGEIAVRPIEIIGNHGRLPSHTVRLNADECIVLADRHEECGRTGLAYHWREMARRKQGAA